MPTLEELLRATVELDGSDLHVTSGSPPQVRVHGELSALDLPRLGPDDTRELVFSALSDAQKRRFEETRELDCSFGVGGLAARFRCNVFRQGGAVAAVYRLVPETIRGLGELGLPPVVETWAERPRGLVLVTGPTGVRQEHHAGRPHRPDQHRSAWAHPDHRRPDRVRARAQALARQSTRAPPRHGELLGRPARRPPSGSRRRADRRAPRLRDHRGRPAGRRNGPPDARDSPHELRLPDDQPAHRHLSRPASGAGARDSSRSWSRASSARRCCRRRAGGVWSRPRC